MQSHVVIVSLLQASTCGKMTLPLTSAATCKFSNLIESKCRCKTTAIQNFFFSFDFFDSKKATYIFRGQYPVSSQVNQQLISWTIRGVYSMRIPLVVPPREASPPPLQLQAPSPNPRPQILSHPMAAGWQAWLFAAALAFFHASEYVLATAFHGRHNVTATSLLISKQYVMAMSFAMLEYLTEILLFPELKEFWFISSIGLVMVLIGEIIRKLAVVTAGHAFTHVIRIYHEDQHQLITHGVYRFMRHPGYSGFLMWAIGTQVMLCNPVSTVGFTLVLWRFFSKRIPYEEFFLRQFFGSEYEEYAKNVPSGLPFIK